MPVIDDGGVVGQVVRVGMLNAEVRLITDVSKMSPWQGEQVVVTYAIQTSLPLESRAEQRREPDYSGFLKKIVPVDPTKEMARVETARGAVWIVPIARIVLFPLRSGVLPIEPVGVVAVERVGDGGDALARGGLGVGADFDAEP